MPVSEAGLPLGSYLLGVAELTAIAAALAFGAVGVRARVLPGWAGAPARLAEAVIWLAMLVWIAEALGAVGLLTEAAVVVACVLVGAGIGLLARRFPGARRVDEEPVLPSRPAGAVAVSVAAVATAAVAAAWALPAAASFSAGIDGVDSMWYHLPQAARFAQTGSVWELHFTDPWFLNWFYPASSELLHGIGILAFGRDLLSPLVNHGFLALGLLGAWCAGRPWGLGPATLTAAGVVFASEMMLDFQAGEARNDAAGLALLLASTGLLANVRAAGAGPAAGGVSGLAAGLAAGVKLSLLAPVAALAAGAVALARPGQRWRTAGVWLVALIAGGGFWYARNVAHAGNPLPWIEGLLPAPEQALELRPKFSVSHYLGDGEVWSDWFLPGLGDGFGPLWPLVLGLVALAVVLGTALGLRARRGESPRAWTTRPFEGKAARAYGGRVPRPDRAVEGGLLVALAAVVVITFVAYVFTPLTASGEEGEPVGFVWNLRYLAPGVGLGLVLLVLVPLWRRPPWRSLVLLGLLAVLLAQVALLEAWEPGSDTGWALASALAVLAAFAVGGALHVRAAARARVPRAPAGRGSPRSEITASVPRPRRDLARLAAVLCAVVVAAGALAGGFALQQRYLEDRYDDVWGSFELDEAIAWANDASGARIATAGRGGALLQYGFYGRDLSNHVQWVGRPGERGAWLPARGCAEWRAAVNAGRYDYVVTTYDGIAPGDDRSSRERDWIRADPAVELILSDPPTAVFELTGPLQPEDCE